MPKKVRKKLTCRKSHGKKAKLNNEDINAIENGQTVRKENEKIEKAITQADIQQDFMNSASYAIHNIKGDGNCLFRAISYGIFNDEEHHLDIRNKIVDYVIANWYEYQPFIVGGGYPNSIHSPQDYSNYMRTNCIHGDHIELQIATILFSAFIKVVNIRNNNISKFGNEDTFENELTLLYNGDGHNGHYNILINKAMGNTQHNKNKNVVSDMNTNKKIIKTSFEQPIRLNLENLHIIDEQVDIQIETQPIGNIQIENEPIIRQQQNIGEQVNIPIETRPIEKIQIENEPIIRQQQKYFLATIERNPDSFYVGEMNQICSYCNALYFELEKTTRKQYNKCCNKGTVVLEDTHDHPETLKNIFLDKNSHSRHFKRNIILYNNCFQFTSIENNLRNIPGQGPYVYAIRGQIFHHYSDINVTRNNQKYGPIYFLDPEQAIEQRINNALPRKVNKKLIKDITVELNNINPFAKQYRHMHEVYQEQLIQCSKDANKIPNVYIKFIEQHRGRKNREQNLPQVNEIAAICHYNEETPPNPIMRVFLKDKDNSKLYTLNQESEFCDPLGFPLLFPFGDLGWHQDHKLNNPQYKRVRVSICQFYAYRLCYRKTTSFQIILHGGALMQQYIVASFLKIEANRINYLKLNQDQLRTEEYYGLVDYVHNRAEQDGIPLGRMIILPSSYQMGPRSQMQRFQDAMAVVANVGCPSLFITMTCNPNWKDILDNLPSNEKTTSNHPFLVNRVFMMKLNELMKDLTKNCIMGNCLAYLYVIEFQKRGLPHAHILITLSNEDKPTSIEQIDQLICAEIPDATREPLLYELVSRFMIHAPCGVYNRNAVCMKDGKCGRHFPKYWYNETTIRDGHVSYRRRHDLKHVVQLERNKHLYIVRSNFVIPYNPYLLLKYNTHINVEICTSSRTIKYLYKYFFKEPDQVVIQIVENKLIEHEQKLKYDEINSYLNGRYMTPPEASWHILKFPFHHNSHHVIRLQIHLPGRQQIIFKEGEEETAINKAKISQLMAWFELNKSDPVATQWLYSEIPLHYVWNNNNEHKWSRRKNSANNIISRIYNISVKQGEQYYLRLLLLHVPGATSFEYLRTINGVILPTFREACENLNLLANDREWDRCMTEASHRQMPREMRNLFAYILAFCEVLDAKILWEKFKSFLIEDYIRRGFINTEAEQKALQFIQRVLLTNGTRLSEFEIQEPLDIGYDNDDDIDIIEQQQITQENIVNLNHDQQQIFNKVMKAVNDNNVKERYIFVQGCAGSGKTYLYNTIISALNRQNKKICTIAWTGVAAALLQNATTVHSRFRLPVPLLDNSTSSLKYNSPEAQFLREIKLIIWDEISMTTRTAFNIVSKTLQELRKNNEPFGGITIVIGGDFRQILPVVYNGDRTTIVAECIKHSPLWNLFQTFDLKINMRINPEQQEFAEWLAKLGSGQLTTVKVKHYNGLIQVPNKCIVTSLNELIYKIFGEIEIDENLNRAILTPLNSDCHLINEIILNNIRGPVKFYVSIDNVQTDNPNEEHNYPAEFLHSINPCGFPQHEIKLKENTVIMLLRNLNVRKSLCNGTRLLIRHLAEHYLDCERIDFNGQLSGDRVFIPRIDMVSNDIQMPFKLKRRQFPVRLSYGMTINKAQGQTLDAVGIYLPNTVFSHGQLYVAFSRARTISQLFVYIKQTAQQGHIIHQNESISYTKNVVYSEIL